MKKVTTLILSMFLSLAIFAQDMVITAIYDGSLSGGQPKGVELYVLNNIPDLSIYGVSSTNNGGGTTGSVEFPFPAIAATAGDYIYVTSDSTDFNTFFGFFPDYETSVVNINGDDAIELYLNGVVVDVAGDVDNDGTGTAWEYKDGWGYRNNCVAPTATFNPANWTFSGVDGLEGGTNNATATSPMPIGTYACGGTAPTTNTVAFTATTGARLENNTTNDTLWIALGDTATQADTIIVQATDVTATYGADYTTTPDFSTGDSIFVATGDSMFMVIVNMIDDAVFEGDESFTIKIASATSGLTIGADSVFTYTITEDEVSTNPVLDFLSAANTITEGDTVSPIIDFSLAAATTDTVWVEVVNGTGAAYTTDYTTDTVITNDTMMFIVNTGDTALQFNVYTVDDAIVESTETITFNIVNVTGSLVVGTTDTYTLTINDNDVPTLPQYPIGTVSTVDANGVADSLNVVCRLTGIVYGENFRTGGLAFSLIDNSGEIACYSNSAAFGYTVAEGDSIVVEGTIDQFNGLTQIVLDTVILVSAGHALKAPTVVTALGENTESDLIQIDSVVIVNPSQWSNSGSGFTVDVTDGTTTFAMRIDNDCDLFGTPVPGYAFRLTGIGGQFDNSNPYTSGYQILPRRTTDIDSLGTAVVVPVALPQYSIGTVTTLDTDGAVDSLGVDCALTGIVYGVNTRASSTGFYFTLIDNTGGIGVFEGSGSVAYTVTEGDEVTVYGNIGQFNGLTQIYIDSIKVNSNGNALNAPIVVTTLDEVSESNLVKIEGVTLVDAAEWTNSGSGFNVDVTDGTNTYTVRIDNDCDLYGQPAPTGKLNITGIGGQFDSSSPYTDGYQILPRYQADIETASGIFTRNVATVNVYPNPANNVINIKLGANEINAIDIIDLTGKTIISTAETRVNVESLKTGVYFVKVNAKGGVYQTKFIKQ